MILDKLREAFPNGKIFGCARLIVGELGLTIYCHSDCAPYDRTDIRYNEDDCLPVAEIHEDNSLSIAGFVYGFRVYPGQFGLFKGISIDSTIKEPA